MYLVDISIFRKFLGKNNFLGRYIPKPNLLPCIIEFTQGDVIKAKVEVISWNEFQDVVKFGKTISNTKNKYWIRGDEWKLDSNGNSIEKLTY